MELKNQPELVEIKGDWAAVGGSWAVFGDSKEDALNKWHAARARYSAMKEREAEGQELRQATG